MERWRKSMTLFWCPWCGETEEAAGPDEIIPCWRCIREFTKLLGFWPQTGMIPLAPGEEPGEPAAARKSFTFVDARTGRVIGATARSARARRKKAC